MQTYAHKETFKKERMTCLTTGTPGMKKGRNIKRQESMDKQTQSKRDLFTDRNTVRQTDTWKEKHLCRQ